MRTRFAPSPTGMLHVGGLRTALFAYLIAQQTDGTFLLRIEDTDREREVEGATEAILRVLHWAGIDPQEGVIMENGAIAQKGDKGPYIQSERLELYAQYAKQLLESGHAYYAFDTKEDIERMREEESKAGNPSPKYDASMRMRMVNSLTLSPEETQAKLDAGEPYVVRLKVDPEKTVRCDDLVRGKVEYKGHVIDDQVLLKSDGFPTYHLACVVDDHLMNIDLVLRGEEWLPSLPKHLLLYEAFGWDTPQFAHVSLLLNKSGGKLSKRQNDVAAEDYIEKGYLPEAILNFLVLLGWNPGSAQELFSLEEMINEFSVERIQKSGAVFDIEKLDWLQGQWMRKMSAAEFADRILPIVAQVHPSAKEDAGFSEKAQLIQERITFFSEAPEMLSYYYSEPAFDMEIVANKKQKVTPDILPSIVESLSETLNAISENDWNEETLKDALLALAKEREWKNGQVFWPLRAILTGLPYSPGAYEVAVALGKQTTLLRLNAAKDLL